MSKSWMVRSFVAAGIALVAIVGGLFLLNRGDTTTAHAQPRTDVPFGFWATDSASRADAQKQVEARAGFALANSEPPKGYEIGSVSVRSSDVPGAGQQAVLDYFGAGFVPPASGPVDATLPHIQVVQWNGTATEGRSSTPIDLGVAGYTASSVNLSADEAKVAGDGGIYQVSGNGRSWTITVFASGAPSRDDLLPFLRALTK